MSEASVFAGKPDRRWRGAPARGAVRLLAIAALGLAIVAAQLEMGLRLRAYHEDLRLDRSLARLESRKPPPEGKTVRVEDMIQLSPDRKIIYELIPDMSVHFLRTVTTNSAGFRSPEIPVEKPPRTLRILGLGDSIMFGFGVNDGETFMDALAERLSQKHPEFRWESINTAVPGYNGVMEVETLEHKGLAYQPDIVVMNFVGGDFDLPNFIRTRSRPLDLGQSLLGDFVRDLIHGRQNDADFALADAPRADIGFEGDPARVPPEYRDMVGWDAYVAAMTRLRDLSDEHGFRVLVMGHPGVYSQVRELGRSLGFPVVDTQKFVHRLMRTMGITDERDRRLIIGVHDSHPTALVHGVIADAILDGLEDSGTLDELLTLHDSKVTGLPRLRVEFWQELRRALARYAPHTIRFAVGSEPVIRATSPAIEPPIELALDRHANHARVGLVLTRPAPGAGPSVDFSSCLELAQTIERDTGSSLVVRPVPNTTTAVAAVARPLDLTDRMAWPATQEWMARAVAALVAAAPQAAACDSDVAAVAAPP